MKKPTGLGRGLGALIPPPPVGLREVPVAAIRPNPRQPRTRFDEDALNELARSMREHGVLQPILLSQQEDGSFQLITGERRWRAAKLAGLETIPAVIKETTPRHSLELAVVENIQRSDLNPLEEAHAYRQLLEEHGLTQEQLAHRIGKSRVAVTNTLRLLQLPEPVQAALAAGELTEGHARAILTAEGEGRRLTVLDKVLGDGLSVRETEAYARRLNEQPTGLASQTENHRADEETERLEEAFRQALGTRVRLMRSRTGAGQLIIHFFSDEQLQGIYEVIVG
jgi:ParB family chromosome partitioning protein